MEALYDACCHCYNWERKVTGLIVGIATGVGCCLGLFFTTTISLAITIAIGAVVGGATGMTVFTVYNESYCLCACVDPKNELGDLIDII